MATLYSLIASKVSAGNQSPSYISAAFSPLKISIQAIDFSPLYAFLTASLITDIIGGVTSTPMPSPSI